MLFTEKTEYLTSFLYLYVELGELLGECPFLEEDLVVLCGRLEPPKQKAKTGEDKAEELLDKTMREEDTAALGIEPEMMQAIDK